MLSGKHFRLNHDTLVVHRLFVGKIAILTPEGQVVTVASDPGVEDFRMVDITWDDRSFSMFLEDLEHRGEEVLATTS